MHRQFSDIPAVVVLHGLKIKSKIIYIWNQTRQSKIMVKDQDP